MLPQEDRALLREDKSRKHLAWRLCGSAVSNFSKWSVMHIKSFINIYYIDLSFSIFLAVYYCFAVMNYRHFLISSLSNVIDGNVTKLKEETSGCDLFQVVTVNHLERLGQTYYDRTCYRPIKLLRPKF
jgi:hypothetical protein